MSMTCDYRVFDKDSPADVESLALLHAALLPHSPVALLGERFMKEFYYGELPGLGMISGVVAYIDQKPAGFIVATQDPAGFMMQGVREKFFKLLFLMIKLVILEPRRIFSIWEALQIMRNLPESAKDSGVGELLSFGVLPEYVKRKIQKAIGHNMSGVLVEKAVDLLAQQKCNEVRAVVDEDNVAAKMFYHGMGWQVSQEKVEGWKVPTMQFVCKIDSSANNTENRT